MIFADPRMLKSSTCHNKKRKSSLSNTFLCSALTPSSPARHEQGLKILCNVSYSFINPFISVTRKRRTDNIYFTLLKRSLISLFFVCIKNTTARSVCSVAEHLSFRQNTVQSARMLFLSSVITIIITCIRNSQVRLKACWAFLLLAHQHQSVLHIIPTSSLLLPSSAPETRPGAFVLLYIYHL